MARVDDYKEAVRLARNQLKEFDPERISGMRGVAFELKGEDKSFLSFLFLNRKVNLSWPGLDLTFGDTGGEVPIQQQVLLFHYLKPEKAVKVEGEWISFQEIPDGRFYMDAFLRRAKNPLVKAFGLQPQRLIPLSQELYGAKAMDQGDYSVMVQALPLVPIGLILWEGDDEFPPEGNLLFDQSIADLLSAEDIAWLAGMVVYPLVGLAKGTRKNEF